jgi:hypothetical protein
MLPPFGVGFPDFHDLMTKPCATKVEGRQDPLYI